MTIFPLRSEVSLLNALSSGKTRVFAYSDSGFTLSLRVTWRRELSERSIVGLISPI
jgi:hypothetical protein